MKNARLLCLLFVSSGQILRPQVPAPQQIAVPEPKTSIEWFSRANEEMNIRMPGSASFHMKVLFHAFPGNEHLGRGDKPDVITGDGIYEETWVASHLWRREVTFADYHAVEVESDHGRKMWASTDYEPSRLMMLLDPLLDPVPRYLVSREGQHSAIAKGWHIDHLANEGTSMVRIARREHAASGEFTDAFYFSPSGILLLEDRYGLTTSWSNGVTFADKIVFTRIVVSAGERTLLTADATIAAEAQADPGEFELEGGSSDAGKTLRPLRFIEVEHGPILLSADPVWPGADHSALSIYGVLDRTGKFREVELIVSVNPGADKDLLQLMGDFRKSRWRPQEIDGYACQTLMYVLYVREVHQQPGSGPVSIR